MKLRNIKIGLRCTLIFSLLGLLSFAMGFIAILQADAMNHQSNLIRTTWLPSVMITGDIANKVGRSRALTLRSVVTEDQGKREKNYEAIVKLNTGVKNDLTSYEKEIANDEDRKLFTNFSASYDRYLEAQEYVLDALNKQGVAAAADIADERLGPSADAMMVELNNLTRFNSRGAVEATEATEATYNKALKIIIVTLILIIIIIVIASISLTRSIVKPLAEAVQVADYISHKDLTQDFSREGNDEPALLLTSLKRMQDSLRETIQKIAASSEQLASASEELHAVTEDTNRGLHQQSAEIEQAATAVNEMTAAVEEVANNAVNTADASKEADSTTKVGREKVELALESIQGLVNDVSNTANEVADLATRATEINRVLDVIGAIAEQTNLLALNAAIEAARAGEAGRGFAVVADEVRALAHRTQQSTGEIESMIGSIRSGTERAVNSMQSSQHRANSTVKVAEAAGLALEVISSSISTINDRNLVIASASEEQAQVAREVDRNLINIRDLSAQTSAGANQTSAASQELSRLATDLNTMVSTFKI